MKKLIYLITIVSVFTLTSITIVSCSDKEFGRREGVNPDDPNAKNCWEFTIKVTTSIKGISLPGYPQVVTTTSKECDLTEQEAEQIAKKVNTTSSSTVQGYTATVVTTCTKRRL